MEIKEEKEEIVIDIHQRPHQSLSLPSSAANSTLLKTQALSTTSRSQLIKEEEELNILDDFESGSGAQIVFGAGDEEYFVIEPVALRPYEPPKRPKKPPKPRPAVPKSSFIKQLNAPKEAYVCVVTAGRNSRRKATSDGTS